MTRKVRYMLPSDIGIASKQRGDKWMNVLSEVESDLGIEGQIRRRDERDGAVAK
jgi:hypothetical protein